jgi:hypothetical protein
VAASACPVEGEHHPRDGLTDVPPTIVVTPDDHDECPEGEGQACTAIAARPQTSAFNVARASSVAIALATRG